MDQFLPGDWVCKGCNNDVDEPIVECTTCKEYYHQACVGVTEESVRDVDWFCPQCKAESKAREKANQQKSISNPADTSVQNHHEIPTHEEPNKVQSVKNMSLKSSTLSTTIQELRDLKLQKLNEEYALKMEFLEKKYEIISEAKSCSKIKSVVEKPQKLEQFRPRANRNPRHDVNVPIAAENPPSKIDNWFQNINFHQNQPVNKVTENPTHVQAPNVRMSAIKSINISDIARATAEQISARNAIPRKLPVFHGNPKDWPMFVHAFTTSTDALQLSNAQNLLRLREHLKGEAYALVEDDLQYPESVPNVMLTLSQLYGRADNVISSIMEKIRKMSPPTYNDMKTIIMYSAAVRSLITRLEASGMSDHINNQNMYFEILNRLPPEIRIDWSRYKRRQNEEANLAALSDYLGYLAEDASQVIIMKEHGNRERNRNKGFVHSIDTVDQYVPGKSSDWENSHSSSCLLCGKNSNHSLTACDRFKKMNVNQRWDVVVKNRLCRKCLKQHFKSGCAKNESKKCDVPDCPSWHNSFLHKFKTPSNGEPSTSSSNNKPTTDESTIVNVCSHDVSQKSVMLRMLPVTLHNGTKSVDVLAFLDDGSSVTLMDDDIASELELSGVKEDLCLKWTSNHTRIEKDSLRTSVTISGSKNSKKYFIDKVFTIKNLGLPKQSLSADIISLRYKHLQNIPLRSYNLNKPRILIGMDQSALGATLEIREGKSDEPIATKTRIGWVVCGPMDGVSENNQYHHFHLCQCEHDETLHQLVKDNFALENVDAINIKLMSKDDERALQLMENSAKKVGNRYEIGLLFRYDEIKLPDSYDMALKRLKCLEQKMSRDETFAANVKKQIAHYIEQNYAQKLNNGELTRTQRTWYLPIFSVTNANKPGKFRLVWDAAAKVNGTSLNTVLLKGPDLLCSLPSVLYKFRIGKIAVAGDIREMYHQVMIIENDRECQRFLWRDGDATKKPDEYQMNVMTFGAACSPSAALFIKNKNARNFENQHPRAVKAILDQHYVDDYLDSFSSEHEAQTVANEVKWIHQQANFDMRNWVSNSQMVLNTLGESVKQSQRNLNVNDGPYMEKMLGMWWLPHIDKFTYWVNYDKFPKDIFNGTRKPTKREVLRILMSVYDPLGLIAFFLVYPKMILQEIWRTGIEWDEQINDAQYKQWNTWTSLLDQLPNIQIDRCYSLKFSGDQDVSIQLHIFSDASAKAYSTVAYFRVKDSNGVDVALIGAKSKVAPINPVSIPRLELQAAILGTRFSKKIQESHPIRIDRTFYWSDSQCVLKWLHADPVNYRQFVSFRVGEILTKTSVGEWYWVPTKENVADDATKWTETPKMSSNLRWFKGPEFLFKDEIDWPGGEWNDKIPCNEELKVQHIMKIDLTLMPKVPVDINKYSDWWRLSQVNAWIHRFCRNLRAKCKNGTRIGGHALLYWEIIQSEIYLYRVAQWEHYSSEIVQLRDEPNKPIDRTSKIRQLSPYYDKEMQLLRVRGRIDAMWGIDEFQKRPIILPRESRVAFLILTDFHERYLHQNFEIVANEVRQKFEIPQLRMKLLSVKANCQQCKNDTVKPRPPEMGDLPTARLSPFTRPFTYVGVDFFGPIEVLVGRRHEKRYGALFTCMTVRAIHIEIAHTLSTDSFILCLHGFMARRGVPIEIRCDNGTNFHGSEHELRKAIAEIRENELRQQFLKIIWKFNPPLSPHQGGAWERLVRSIKTNLKRVLPQRTPSEELLRGCLMEVEMIVNSRPLTYMPVNPENPEALTPNHFLLGSSSGAKPAGIFSDKVLVLRENWKISQKIGELFWKRWVSEYAPTLTRRTKWFDKVKPLEIGDVVVIVDEKLQRNQWPLGIIIDTKPAKDGQVRQATVRTNHGDYVRPATKIAVLDVMKEDG